MKELERRLDVRATTNDQKKKKKTKYILKLCEKPQNLYS